MRPSRCWPARPACGWTRRLASSSGTRSSHATRSRMHSSEPGATSGAFAIRIGSTPGSTDSVNACLDIVRRRKRRAIEVELTPIHIPTTGDFTSAVVDRDLLDRGLRALEPSWRAIVVLHYFLGMPLQDVAVAMRIPIGTVKSRLNRSLRTMRVALSDAEIDEPTAVPGGQFA